jgi:DNA-directed RNA polymerase subunit M
LTPFALFRTTGPRCGQMHPLYKKYISVDLIGIDGGNMAGMFCPTCKGIMYPLEGKLVCRKCGGSHVPEARTVTKEIKKSMIADPHEEVVDVATLPTTKVECPGCKNLEAYWYLRQTRASDEPMTRFYICTKCKKTWREY